MASSPTPRADGASRANALRQARILIDKTVAWLGERQDAKFQALRTSLYEAVDARPHTTQAQNLRAVAGLLDKQGAVYRDALLASFRHSIEDEIDAVLPGSLAILRPADSSDDSSGPHSMALLDVDEIERHLLVDRIAQRFNARYEPVLTPLIPSLAALFGQEDFGATDNPFRPAVLIRAYGLAWELCAFDPLMVEDFLSALDPRCCGDWTALYTTLAENLVRSGFTARTAHRIRRTEESEAAARKPGATGSTSAAGGPGGGPGGGGTAASGAGGGGSGPGSGAGGGAGAGPSGGSGDGAAGASAMFINMAERARQFLQQLGFGRSADDGSGPAGLPEAVHAPPDPGLLGFLGKLQLDPADSTLPPIDGTQTFGGRNLLRQMRERDEVQGATELDRGTIDALAEVFDYVFADPTIPVQLKYVIGRLQIPVLKAAMIDRHFFLSGVHPARQLVDALAAAAVGWAPERGDKDPLYVTIDGTVRRVLAEFRDDLGLFDTLLEEFQAFMGQFDEVVEQRIDPQVRDQGTAEARDAALAHADEVIHHCIEAADADAPLQPFLVPFLTQQWREVMARAWMAREDEPERWELALQTMDQVIWSTRTQADAQDRARLVAVLPDLVRELNTQLDAIRWQDEAREAFTRRLIATHMRAIRSPKSAPAPLETTPDPAQEAAGKAALRALEQRRAAQPAPQEDQFDDMARQLTRGLWFDFAGEAGNVRRYRLGWVSPQRSRLLFTNRDGFEAFVHSEREVAQLLREGRLAVLDQQPIVARAIDQIMGGARVAEPELELA